MKKNNVMRVFSLLLALTLISVCAISGTFAKYVTKAEGTDQARVAKWGVVLTVEGKNFADKYLATDEAYTEDGGEYSVVSSVEGEAVVAPGTPDADDGLGMVATVKGTPEVATRYTLEGKAVKDVVLKKGTYTDYTQLVKAADGTYGYTGTFNLDKDYAPVKWNLKISKGSASYDVATDLYRALGQYPTLLAAAESYGFSKDGCSFFDAIAILKKVADDDTYTQIVETVLGNIVSGGRNFQLDADPATGTFKLSYDFDPNKEMDFTFELSWAWAFEKIVDNAADPIVDAADTYLGNVAAGVITDDNANTTIAATLTATATQID
jgi:hypothetical protein